MEKRLPKESALTALHEWRSYLNYRDPLVTAAAKAGASQAEIIQASGLAKGTVRTILDTAQEETDATTTTDPLAGLHHPNFVRLDDSECGIRRFLFRPFTGDEPEPTNDIDVYPTHHQQFGEEPARQLQQEYDVARMHWKIGRYKKAVKPLLKKAAPLWEAYAAARRTLEETFQAFDTTPDTMMWKSQILELSRAHTAALQAAGDWDSRAEDIAKAADDHLEGVFELRPRLEDVAAELCIDTQDWEIERSAEAYTFHGTGVRYGVAQLIEQQKEELSERLVLAFLS